MKDWFSAAEIAAFKLPGMPATTRGVVKMAERDRWPSRPRDGRGGGSEYHLVMLPRAARIALADLSAGIAANDGAAVGAQLAIRADSSRRSEAARAARSSAAIVAIDGKAEARMDAGLAVLALFRDYLRASGKPRTTARPLFCEAYNAGRLAIDDDLRKARPSLSVPTLQRLERRARKGGAVALAGRYGNRKGSGRIDGNPAIRQLVEGMVAGFPHVEAENVMKALRARARKPGHGFGPDDLPGYRTLQRWLQRWREDHKVDLLALSDPDAHKSRTRVSFGSASADVAALNGEWEMDSTPGDALLKDGRHTIVGCIDIWSRRIKLLVSRTSKSVAIVGLVRRCLLEWGVPVLVRTDQGADYTSRHMKRALASLEIHHVACPPFSPEKKPFIERGLGTFSHGLLELMDGFIGHDVAERQALRARQTFADRLMKRGEVVDLTLLTAVQLQEFCDRWADDVYGMQPHSNLGGLAPKVKAASWTGEVRRIADEHALDILLARAPASQGNDDGWRTVGKKGLAIDGGTYIAAELGPYVGRRVRVLYDPTELARVHVFEEDGAFVCIAFDPTRTGIDRRAVSIAAGRLQRAKAAEARKHLKGQAAAAKVGGIAREILDGAREISAAVVAFPASTTEIHMTPALLAAAEAAGASEGVAAEPIGPEQAERMAKVVALYDAPMPERADEGDRLWAEVQALETRKKAGALTAEDADRLTRLNALPQVKVRRWGEEMEEGGRPQATG